METFSNMVWYQGDPRGDIFDEGKTTSLSDFNALYSITNQPGQETGAVTLDNIVEFHYCIFHSVIYFYCLIFHFEHCH